MEKQNYMVGTQPDVWKADSSQQITFIVTADCNLRCKYCYITHKSDSKVMDFEVAKKFIDYILDTSLIRKQEAVVLDFIGGEPLIEVELIDQICDYFKKEAFKRNDPWYWNYKINICTNGVNYSSEAVQKFIRKNIGKVYISITIDGTKEKHDMQRVFPDGSGSYDIIRKNVDLWLTQFDGSTKVTFASDDLPLLKESIIQLLNDGIKDISANVVFEDVWKEGDNQVFEEQLKQLADYIIDNDLYNEFRCTLFSDAIGGSYTEDDLTNTSCGAGKMLALGPNGDIYPCMRYYDYSLNKKEGLVIGNINDGIDLEKVRPFETVMYKYQSDEECLNCDVAKGCNFCQGFNYDEADTKTNFQRAKYICKMHKARVRANNYYFARLLNEKGIAREYVLNQKKSMLFILDDHYESICSYDTNRSARDRRKMDKETVLEGLRFAAYNFMKPVFLYSQKPSVLDEIKDELTGYEILHIFPASMINQSDYIHESMVTVSKETIDMVKQEMSNIIFNIHQDDIQFLPDYIRELFTKVDRININIMNLDRNFDLDLYDRVLEEIAKEIVLYVQKENVLKEINLLTDIFFITNHGNCKAGEDVFTYAPDGKIYACPAFYYEKMESIGDVNIGIQLKNKHLWTNKYAPLCNACDSYQCENCKFINIKNTGEVNVSPSFQCKKAHIERKNALWLQSKIEDKVEMLHKLETIEYQDPFEILNVTAKNIGFYNC